MTPASAALMADYNRWMNRSLYAAAAKLPDTELAADRGAFFGSILGTLNHIAVADTIWLKRFALHDGGAPALAPLADVERPTSLRQTIADDLAELTAYRERLDDLIVQWAGALTPEQLAAPLTYSTTAGVPSRKNFGFVVQHFFNHQTHHRGQATTLLFQAGIDVGVTDLAALIPNEQA